MRIFIPFQNPRTGEIKRVKIGFSWTLFFFSGILGLPLFMRGLNSLGLIMLVLWIINFFVFGENPDGAIGILFVAWLMQTWLGFKGNKMTAISLLDKGWSFLEPDSEFTKMARMSWNLMPVDSNKIKHA